MKGLIVTNGYYRTAASVHQSERMKTELQKLGIEIIEYANNRPYETDREFDADFAVFFDKDMNLAKCLENSGIRVFNSLRALEIADDKIKTYLALKNSSVAYPKTIPAPIRYDRGIDGDFLKKVGEELGFPLVVKAAKGSLGENVFLAENLEELIFYENKLALIERLYQCFNRESRGRSIRAIVVGKKFICAMKLVNEKDFRSNASMGGRAEKIDLNKKYIESAEKIASILDLDFCGVDFFAGEPTLIEVNSNAYFRAIEEVTSVNVAAHYAAYIFNTMRGTAWKP